MMNRIEISVKFFTLVHLKVQIALNKRFFRQEET